MTDHFVSDESKTQENETVSGSIRSVLRFNQIPEDWLIFWRGHTG